MNQKSSKIVMVFGLLIIFYGLGFLTILKAPIVGVPLMLLGLLILFFRRKFPLVVKWIFGTYLVAFGLKNTGILLVQIGLLFEAPVLYLEKIGMYLFKIGQFSPYPAQPCAADLWCKFICNLAYFAWWALLGVLGYFINLKVKHQKERI